MDYFYIAAKDRNDFCNSIAFFEKFSITRSHTDICFVVYLFVYVCSFKDMTADKLNTTSMPKSYHSPWEEAILRDPDLAETLKLRMPPLQPRSELPEYKSFNR